MDRELSLFYLVEARTLREASRAISKLATSILCDDDVGKKNTDNMSFVLLL